MKAVLVLKDGTKFYGKSIGYHNNNQAYTQAIGEVVFNTSMTGYQEILSDPSYQSQMITLTYPHIGNVGINIGDSESTKIYASALIIRDYSRIISNWRATQSLSEFLIEHQCIGISEIDTRALTRHLREHGAQNGTILISDHIDEIMLKKAMSAANNFAGLKNLDLAKIVSTQAPYNWNQGEWNLIDNDFSIQNDYEFHIVAMDFGIKRNILRMLAQRRCKITVVPAQTSLTDILALQPDGVFLSNGPGDPEPCDYAITTIQGILDKNIPIFGICLGHQLLGLAAGAKTVKMKTGHHGGNHPVYDRRLKKVLITSQNHGFAIDEHTLPDNIKIFAHSLFDQSIQGIELTDHPAFGFQGHPEASPGPCDIAYLFDDFIDLITSTSQNNPSKINILSNIKI